MKRETFTPPIFLLLFNHFFPIFLFRSRLPVLYVWDLHEGHNFVKSNQFCEANNVFFFFKVQMKRKLLMAHKVFVCNFFFAPRVEFPANHYLVSG